MQCYCNDHLTWISAAHMPQKEIESWASIRLMDMKKETWLDNIDIKMFAQFKRDFQLFYRHTHTHSRVKWQSNDFKKRFSFIWRCLIGNKRKKESKRTRNMENKEIKQERRFVLPVNSESHSPIHSFNCYVLLSFYFFFNSSLILFWRNRKNVFHSLSTAEYVCALCVERSLSRQHYNDLF